MIGAVLYRDHCGHLNESMGTVQEFTSLKQLIDYFNEYLSSFHRKVEAIKFEHMGLDKRTGWDTYAVMVKDREKDRLFYPLGFSNGVLE